MASSSQLAGLGANLSWASGTLNWTNPTNIYADDTSYATASSSSDYITHYLRASNFGFAIPSGATILGFQAIVRVKASSLDPGNTYVTFWSLKPVDASGALGAEKLGMGSSWPVTESDMTFGSATDLWGMTLTPDVVNDTDFGVAISAKGVMGTGEKPPTAYIDCVTIVVYYSTFIPKCIFV